MPKYEVYYSVDEDEFETAVPCFGGFIKKTTDMMPVFISLGMVFITERKHDDQPYLLAFEKSMGQRGYKNFGNLNSDFFSNTEFNEKRERNGSFYWHGIYRNPNFNPKKSLHQSEWEEAFLIPYSPMPVRNYIVTTCEQYMEDTLPSVIDGLKKAGIENNQITVMVGNSDREEIAETFGIKYVYFPYNFYEYNGFYGCEYIDIKEDEYYFFVHDTVIIGERFKELTQLGNRYMEPDVVYASFELPLGHFYCHCNIGAYRGSFIKDQIIPLIRPFDKGSKDFAVAIECNKNGLGLLNLAETVHSFTPAISIVGDNVLYQGRLRGQRYMPSVDLFKFWNLGDWRGDPTVLGEKDSNGIDIQSEFVEHRWGS